MLTSQRITNLESDLKACTATSHTAGTSSWSNHLQSVLIVAFQFPFESHILENIATMAREYVVNVIYSVQRVALAIKSPGLIPHVGPKLIAGSPEAATLASWICRSYRQVGSHKNIGKSKQELINQNLELFALLVMTESLTIRMK